MNDLVSIIIPLYNAEKYIDEAIQSVLAQSYLNWELIIVNDGSTDDSLSVARKYEGEKIKVYSQENKGSCAANNFGFSKSKGSYIKFFDADDILSQDMLLHQVTLLKENPKDVISSKWGRFYANDLSSFKLSYEDNWKDMKPVDWLCSSWHNGTSMMQCAMFLIPRNIIDEVGLWNESLTVINDLEFYTRVILGATHIRFSEQSILYYRSGNLQTVSGRKGRKSMESSFTSIDLSTQYLLAFSGQDQVKQCAANVWQSFIYECYPAFSDLTTTAEEKIKRLRMPNLVFHVPQKIVIVRNIFGWKFAKRLIQFFRNF